MNKIRLTFLIALAGMVCSMKLSAQQASAICSNEKIRAGIHAKTTVADTLEDAYDIHYVKFDISATNTSDQINGNVITKASVTATQLDKYTFELNTGFVIDSVKLNGVLSTATNNAGVVKVPFTQPLLNGQSFTAQVYYHGQPAGGTPNNPAGLRWVHSPTWNTDATFTLSEPYEAKDWWPCKQSLTDKIDSADIWITVPSTLRAGSNGLLKNITAVAPAKSRYEWKSSYPMDYYLLSIAVAPYDDYTYYVHFNTTDSMPVQNYVYSNTQALSLNQSKIDSVGNMILYFSDLFGRYPFWKEKYGHCLVPLGGGMEHQTMTSLGNFGTTLTAHELAHQWFGNHVTCGSWHDIWLDEGIACYSEYLYVDHFRGAADAFNYMTDIHTEAMSAPGGSVYVDDTTNESRIFSSRLTYKKGASVLHTLRFIINDDNDFFQILKNYQQQYAFGTAKTEDMQQVAEQIYGNSLDTFFHQWIYGEGYPVYQVAWNQVNDNVYIQLNQSGTVPSSVPVFSIPLEIRLSSATGDTTIRVYNNQSTQLYSFKWSQPISGITIDPNDWVLNNVTSTIRDLTLSTGSLPQPGIVVHPNPANESWLVEAAQDITLSLYDISGKEIWHSVTGNKLIKIPADKYVPGVYFLKAKNGVTSSVYKLIKQ